MSAIVLAWRHMRFHAGRTVAMILAAALVLAAPAMTRTLLDAAERRLSARAQATPFVIGPRGSQLDLAMTALYFAPERVDGLTLAASEAVWDGGLAEALPLHARFTAGGAPVIGATLDYLDFRGLAPAQGRGLGLLGEALLGAAAARRLDLGPGDHVVSDPATLFDLAGVYPLRMPVVGVLAPTGTPDDDAVFVDLRTAWVIEGIGHGHDDVIPDAPDDAPDDDDADDADPAAPFEAPAALRRYREITEANVDDFHFHGDADGYPISAVIAVPYDARSAVILQGRYLDDAAADQIVRPSDLIGRLLKRIVRLRAAMDAAAALMATGAAAAIGLAVFLSLQLRRREMATAFRLGASRGLVLRLAGAEVVIVLAASALLAAGLAALARFAAEDAARWLLSIT